MRAQKGFTLVELLVVLLILGVLLALAPPVFNRALPGLELRAAAREVAATLREARGRAIRANREAAVAFDLAEGVYRLEGKAGIHSFKRTCELTLVVGASERLGDDGGRIRFFPDGPYLWRSTWFDADYFGPGILTEERFTSLADKVGRICDAYQVDESRFVAS